MASSRREKKADERPAEAIHFAPLDGSGWEDSGYLPPDDDQSWREMEALRIGAYDRIGHLPPKGNQSWREQEALRLATTREAVSDADDTANAGDPIADLAAPDPVTDPTLDAAADAITEPGDSKSESYVPVSYVPVREPEFQPARRGAGGVMLLLVAVVGLVTVALAVPGVLTPDFWRAQWAAVTGKSAATPERMASVPAPAPPALRPLPVQPAPVSTPALNTAPPANSEPPGSAEPPATAEPQPTADAMPDVTPSPRPDIRGDRATMVIGSDGSVKYEDAAAGSKPGPARRTAAREERDAGGFYAMAPGPDGILRRQFFPSGPLTDSAQTARAPSRDDAGGVYAMAPGPDGKLTYQYFPSKPR
jgi:hypothetical protein